MEYTDIFVNNLFDFEKDRFRANTVLSYRNIPC